MAIDPVCKMSVDPERAPAKAEHAGKTYYFCCAACQKAFLAQPEKYLGGGTAPGGAPHGHRAG